MGSAWIRIGALAAMLALTAPTLSARAYDAQAWSQDRQAHFSAYQSAHPNPDAEIAQVKAKSAALLAAAPAFDPSVVDPAPLIWRTSKSPLDLWDGPAFPRMRVVPAGEYTMGSPDSEPQREAGEGPRHRVRIAQAFAVSEFPVTVGEYAQFVADTHYDPGEACYTLEGGVYKLRGARNFDAVGFEQTGDSPVVCVSFDDAKAYVAWLSKKTGHAYRLLSEAEYEYVNRAGTTTIYWWGDQVGQNHANCAGCGSVWDNRQTAPVGRFASNAFGLYDTSGNTFSWVADCANPNYLGAPADGSANLSGECDLHILRGGSLHNSPDGVRSARRSHHWFSLRNLTVGLRIARTL
jgi:formylglycine-generating enzyme required for sulfatase activity